MPIPIYSVESLHSFLPDCTELLIRNWKEIAVDQDTIALQPDFQRYVELEKNGKLLITTVRFEGKLVGYCVMIVDTNLHYSALKCSVNDVIYLDPEYRKGRIGINLIKFTEKQLTDYLIVWHVKKAHPALGKVLQHLGYQDFEIMYRKKV